MNRKIQDKLSNLFHSKFLSKIYLVTLFKSDDICLLVNVINNLPPSEIDALAPVYFCALMCCNSSLSSIQLTKHSVIIRVLTNTIALMLGSSAYVEIMISFNFSRSGFSEVLPWSSADASNVMYSSFKRKTRVNSHQIQWVNSHFL